MTSSREAVQVTVYYDPGMKAEQLPELKKEGIVESVRCKAGGGDAMPPMKSPS
jgi:hypothetical protein